MQSMLSAFRCLHRIMREVHGKCSVAFKITPPWDGMTVTVVWLDGSGMEASAFFERPNLVDANIDMFIKQINAEKKATNSCSIH